MTSFLNVPTVGASGAVFGILAAFATLFPNVKVMLLFPPIPMKAKYLVLGYIAFEIYRIIQNAPNDNVAHFAHLGGALIGYLLISSWKKQNFRRF